MNSSKMLAKNRLLKEINIILMRQILKIFNKNIYFYLLKTAKLKIFIVVVCFFHIKNITKWIKQVFFKNERNTYNS